MRKKILKFQFLSALFFIFCFKTTAVFSQTDFSDTLNTPSVVDLGEVVVTATRTVKTLKSTPVITQVITAKKIEERGLSDIKTLLEQEVPGLNFQEVGFGTSIQMQGLDAKHILFLVDGERLAGETGNNIDYSRLNLSNVERIEIVKGASSAIYGSQAMGGVVNIITKNAKKKVELNLGSRYAQRNELNYPDLSESDEQYTFRRNTDRENLNVNASLGLNFDKFKAYTDVRYQSFDGYQLYDKDSVVKYFPEYDTTIYTRLSTTPTNISGYQDLNVSQKLSYQINPNLKLSAKGTYYELNKFDFVPNYTYENNIDFSYGVNLDYMIDSASSLFVSYYADNYKRYDKYELLDEKDLSYRNDMIQPKILFNTTAFKKQVLTAGVEFLRETLYGDQFESGELESKQQWNMTAFVQDELSLSPNFNIIGGLRADYHEVYKWKVCPKVSVLYRMFPVTLRLNYASGYRSPTLKELYMNWDHLGMFWIYGNKNLKPETNNYLSISAEFVSSVLYATVTGYGNWFRNKIEGVWQNDQTEFHYINMGKTTLSGIETTVRLKLFKGLFLNGAFNYLNSKDNEGVKLSTASPLSGNVRLEYTFSKKFYKANINIVHTFMGAKDYDVLDKIKIDGVDTEAYYKAHVDPYSMWSVAFSQTFADNLRLTVGVNNLLDYRASIINFNSSTSPGRRFYVAFNMNIDRFWSK